MKFIFMNTGAGWGPRARILYMVEDTGFMPDLSLLSDLQIYPRIGIYTFTGHLRWTWAIALGYAASIWVHLMLNAKLFT